LRISSETAERLMMMMLMMLMRMWPYLDDAAEELGDRPVL
jgi:hypothetical protein